MVVVGKAACPCPTYSAGPGKVLHLSPSISRNPSSAFPPALQLQTHSVIYQWKSLEWTTVTTHRTGEIQVESSVPHNRTGYTISIHGSGTFGAGSLFDIVRWWSKRVKYMCVCQGYISDRIQSQINIINLCQIWKNSTTPWRLTVTGFDNSR